MTKCVLKKFLIGMTVTGVGLGAIFSIGWLASITGYYLGPAAGLGIIGLVTSVVGGVVSCLQPCTEKSHETKGQSRP